MKIAFYTLGCKVNQYETQALEQVLTGRGHTLVPFDGEADAYIINTCTVTAVSDKKSRQMIRRARKAAPDAVIAVCGCYPQTHPDAMDGLGVDLVSGTGDRLGFAGLLERTWQERQPVTALDNAFDRRSFEILPAGGLEGRTRAMLKIEDGCVNFCSYCIIPYARGRVRSLSPQDTRRELERLLEAGYREIVLTGIEISSWGQDLPGEQTLIDLLETVCRDLPGEVRIRLGSLEPRTITPDFCRRAAALPNLCPHFHLSMQSGCDAVLARMNRKYDSARYYESVQLLHGYFDRPAITTDLIVGFPGETEEEFDELYRFLDEYKLERAGVFAYSQEEGTVAARMENQIPEEEKRRRQEILVELQDAVMDQFSQTLVGTQQKVLCCGYDAEHEMYFGRTYMDSPDVDGIVYFYSEEPVEEGSFVTVEIENGAELYGEIVG